MSTRHMLREIAEQYGLEWSDTNTTPPQRTGFCNILTAGRCIIVNPESNPRAIQIIDDLGVEVRMVHLYRDPRDLLVSAYFSHLNSHPDEHWPSLAAHRVQLRKMDKESGMLKELQFIRYHLDALADWPDRPDILNVPFGSLATDPYLFVCQILRYFTLPIVQSVIRPIADRYRFESLTGGRLRGQSDEMHHNRRGVVGDFREHFTPRVERAFLRLYRDRLDRWFES